MIDKNFFDLINNKKIIFIGPSRIMLGSRKKKWIDSFDVVVRTNGSFPIKTNNIKDLSKRCEILYVNVQFLRVNGDILPLEDFKKQGMKFLCVKAGMPDKEKLSEYNKYVKVRSYLQSNIDLKDSVKGMLSGSAILNDILKYKPKELWVTGIDFYINGQWRWDKNYIDDYIPEKAIEQAQKKLEKKKLIPHNIESNKKYMIDLYKKNLIKFDDDVLKILGLYKNEKNFF